MGIFDLVLPVCCGVCGRTGAAVCDACLEGLVRCRPPFCERCGAPGPWPVRRCADCSGRRLAFVSARAALVYEVRAQALISSWKERGRRDLAAAAARLVVEVVLRPNVGALTFVPGDRDRYLRRGHAPAAALAAELSSSWSLPCLDLLRRRPGIERQRDLPRGERHRNVAGAFAARGGAPVSACLVDDVYTTGSTVTACATALRRAGTCRVEVVCLARAVR
jgi:predicted amidophosphoribosyltransferase